MNEENTAIMGQIIKQQALGHFVDYHHGAVNI